MSDYAAELRNRSFWWRFPPEMEREFVASQEQRDLKRARSGLIAVLLLVAAMVLAHAGYTPVGFSDRTNVMRILGIGLPFALGLAATYWSLLRRSYQWVLMGVLVVASANSVLISLVTTNAGLPYYSSGLMVLILVNYFVLGLEWRRASVVGLMMFGSYATVNLLSGGVGEGFATNAIFLAFANWAGIVGSHQRSEARRKSFLEHQVAEALSGLDQLTGLSNRRRLDQELDLYWRRAKRESLPLSVVLIDIDYFKPYNDRLGHQAGDTCLREFAQLLQKQARDTDFVARYGGEEFAVLLPGTDSEGAGILAERMRKAIVAENIPHPASSIASHVTASIGVATVWPDNTDRSLQGFVQMADESLYEAKGAGRNTVVACTDQDKLVSTGVFKVRPIANSPADTGRVRRDN